MGKALKMAIPLDFPLLENKRNAKSNPTLVRGLIISVCADRSPKFGKVVIYLMPTKTFPELRCLDKY